MKMLNRSERYQNVLESVKTLKPEEMLNLLADIAALLQSSFSSRPKHRVTELEGLGAEIWQNIEIEEYIEQEHVSWD